MVASFDRCSFQAAILILLTAVACGGQSTDETDGGVGGAAASGGASNTGGSSGSGGAGGGAATGGASGSGGTGRGGTGGLTPGDSGTCGCTGSHVGWGMNGGNGLYQESSALEICNLFLHQRVPRAPDPPGVSCEQPITDCVGKFGPGDVTRAITNADVRAAIAASPVLYGEDPRPYDGQVLRIQIASAIIEVGTDCRVAGCKPVPAGVNALAELLKAITKQELSRVPCSMTFPPPP